jgi:hypothetical protein
MDSVCICLVLDSCSVIIYVRGIGLPMDVQQRQIRAPKGRVVVECEFKLASCETKVYMLI